MDRNIKVVTLSMSLRPKMLAVLVAGIMLGQTAILYDPDIILNRMTPASAVFYAAYAVFCLLPFGLQVAGERRLKSSLAHVAS